MIGHSIEKEHPDDAVIAALRAEIAELKAERDEAEQEVLACESEFRELRAGAAAVLESLAKRWKQAINEPLLFKSMVGKSYRDGIEEAANDLLSNIRADSAAALAEHDKKLLTPKITRREWGIRETEPRTYSEAMLADAKRKAVEYALSLGGWSTAEQEKYVAQLRAEAESGKASART